MRQRSTSPRSVATYWWVGRPNFGDLLAAPLLKHFSNIRAEWTAAPRARLVAVGSIIEHIPTGWTGQILGSGKLHRSSLLPISAEILALRGPLSAAGVRGDFALGDPGLLASELVRVNTKTHALGIVPHWSDRELASDPRFLRYDPLIIDPRGAPLEVIAAIGGCQKIVTSSLHGMILADAFGIPRRFETTPRLEREGGLFKFEDYSLAIKTPFEVGITRLANRQAVDDRKSEIYDCFRSLDCA